MIPVIVSFFFFGFYLSRVCGDDPDGFMVYDSADVFVPRMRG